MHINNINNNLTTQDLINKLPKEAFEKLNKQITYWCKNNLLRICKNCGRSIMHKHKNAKFCSNKGIGNCKDAYNNSIKYLKERE